MQTNIATKINEKGNFITEFVIIFPFIFIIFICSIGITKIIQTKYTLIASGFEFCNSIATDPLLWVNEERKNDIPTFFQEMLKEKIVTSIKNTHFIKSWKIEKKDIYTKLTIKENRFINTHISICAPISEDIPFIAQMGRLNSASNRDCYGRFMSPSAVNTMSSHNSYKLKINAKTTCEISAQHSVHYRGISQDNLDLLYFFIDTRNILTAGFNSLKERDHNFSYKNFSTRKYFADRVESFNP